MGNAGEKYFTDPRPFLLPKQQRQRTEEKDENSDDAMEILKFVQSCSTGKNNDSHGKLQHVSYIFQTNNSIFPRSRENPLSKCNAHPGETSFPIMLC